MTPEFSRTELVYGEEAMDRIRRARVAVFGIGGVGGYVTEALARSGVGQLDIVDNDTVSITNINRQIIALHSTVGEYKVDAAESRIRDINPGCIVRKYRTFYLPETENEFDFSQYDYIVDAIDTVTGKIAIVVNAEKTGTPVISSMGTGNKIHPALFEVADIYDTEMCPLAKVMRHELKKRGIRKLKVVYSKEKPLTPSPEAYAKYMDAAEDKTRKRSIPGSTAFAPPVAGLIIASEVINDIAFKD